jgi:hypothetical protein
MVRYCKETKRILCGCHNGRLVMYEFKTSKWNFQSYPAHNSQGIAAVAISGDSKYIASYSAHDNSLIFWQVCCKKTIYSDLVIIKNKNLTF